MTELQTMVNEEVGILHKPWHIAGIGAMGSLLAGRFCHGGQVVHLILKNEHQLAAYQQSKLTVIDDNDVFTCHPQAVDIRHLRDEPIHHLLCSVKAYDATKLLRRLKHYLNEHSIIILLHNGLGVLDEIQAQLPQLRIIAGITTVGAYLEKPYTVRAFLDGKFHLGSMIGQFTTNEISHICKTFQDAKLPIQWEKQIDTMMWEKFALNCSINLLTALFTCKNGDLLTHVALLKKMTDEISQVLNAYHISMSAEDLFLKVTHLLHSVANNYSSMCKDVLNNRPTELHYLNEHLIQLAHQKKIPIPVNMKIVNQFYAKFPHL